MVSRTASRMKTPMTIPCPMNLLETMVCTKNARSENINNCVKVMRYNSLQYCNSSKL